MKSGWNHYVLACALSVSGLAHAADYSVHLAGDAPGTLRSNDFSTVFDVAALGVDLATASNFVLTFGMSNDRLAGAVSDINASTYDTGYVPADNGSFIGVHRFDREIGSLATRLFLPVLESLSIKLSDGSVVAHAESFHSQNPADGYQRQDLVFDSRTSLNLSQQNDPPAGYYDWSCMTTGICPPGSYFGRLDFYITTKTGLGRETVGETDIGPLQISLDLSAHPMVSGLVRTTGKLQVDAAVNGLFQYSGATLTFSASPAVPEPGSWALCVAAGVAIGVHRRANKRRL